MCFIHKEDILLFASLCEESLEIYMRIEQIIVIADYSIGEQAYIQTEFKGTDHMLPGVFKYGFFIIGHLTCQYII